MISTEGKSGTVRLKTLKVRLWGGEGRGERGEGRGERGENL